MSRLSLPSLAVVARAQKGGRGSSTRRRAARSGFGGGTVVERNAIFNQCRQSGDHGPINSWDRQAFLTDVRYGPDRPSFSPAPNVIRHNVIFANYGGSQGVDNDDGSAWFDIHANFMWGEGLKMDYGGHDSKYHGNVNVVHPYDGQQCVNVWEFAKSGNAPCVGGEEDGACSHAHMFYNNTCVVLADYFYGTQQQEQCTADDGTFNEDARAGMVRLHDNAYFSPNGTVLLKCPDKHDEVTLAFLQSGGVENRSTAAPQPPDETIVQWARDVVGF